MSAANLLSALKEKPTDGSPKEGSKHEGDDDASGGGGCGDPAVLAVGSVLKPLTYTRDELLKLRNSPLVKQGFEKLLANCEALVLVLKKRTESPHEEDRGAKGDAPTENHKSVLPNTRGERERERRSADPRERVRKESEPTGGGIVLSPQRRSFTSGCGAPAASAPPPPHVARTRPESPLSSAAAALSNGKNDQARRVGSGRLVMRDMTTAPWEREEGERDSFRDNFRGTNREREERTIPRSNDSRYERRSFNRDNFHSDVKRERDDRFIFDKRDDNRRSNNRYSRRFDKEEEPEWFSGGPTSQLETIELRGFDDPPKRNGNVSGKSEKWSSGSRSPQESWRDQPSNTSPANDSPTVSSTPTANQDEEPEKESNEKQEDQENMMSLDHADFNFDEFLKFESIPDILTNGTSDSEGGGSRFSRYFQRSETPTQHYERLLHNLVDELDNNCTATTPANVFAPISPAAPPPPASHRGQPPSLMELLRRANSNEHHQNMNSVSGGGKMHSLEELEARLRPQHPPPMHQPPQQDHDLSAFKRLLAQVSGGHAVQAEPQLRPPQQPQQPPMSLLQMLKSMEQQKPQQPHIPQDLLYKLLQVQRQQDVGPGMHPGMTPQDRDLLQRPEAIALIQGLKSGEITIQHLMQQLNNPAVQCRHRELLLAILRMHHHHHSLLQMGGSPLPGGVGVQPPHLIVPPPHQQLRISPIPHHSVPQRIPSPRELAAHTQSIMQGALIKKKLEEQKENYRRRTEQMAKQTPPISFTPTSVLRKMTADKEEPLSPKQQWNQPPKMPQGRPIVKGNQSGMPSGIGFSPSPSDFQHFVNQQQQMAANRPFPHPQQRQVPPMMNNMNRGASSATLHQLLVQSHQRSMNEMGGGSGGGDNQLARWFSPELLAQASAGKLPSVHVPNALSLEDLERGHHSPAKRSGSESEKCNTKVDNSRLVQKKK